MVNHTENQKKLLEILSEIFQLDQTDLDFGIYRVMNSKSEEIKDFLDNDLISNVVNAFDNNKNNPILSELDEAIKQAQALGVDADSIPKVKELKDKLAVYTTSNNLENDVFSHLITFFKRYYKNGDFVSLRRYKKDTYAIPYEGEEVKLHWANSDQYYIKTSEYFRDYSFKDKGKTIHFKISDAETESNNNKATKDKERRFVILDDNPCDIFNDELFINFDYKAVGKSFKQDKLNKEAIEKTLENIEDDEFIAALNTLAPTEKNNNRTIFEKHLNSYTSKNSFDYFIHKNLGGFLNRELDFYIKNEILFLDDIMESPVKYDEVMGKVKIFKSVAKKIIEFLTQLEDFQKKLWEKKKFVIETNYCITLDKINEKYYKKILENKEQLDEWKTLFHFDLNSEKNDSDLFDKNSTNIDVLKNNPFLVLDTKFFDTKFKYNLLEEFENLDENIDGVLINSENFGALNLLQKRYKEQIKTVYIDPPYNTGNDGFLYSDSFQHSSWMSFMYDRLALGRELMSADGVIFTSIDDKEVTNLNIVFDCIFNKDNFIAQTIRASNSSKNNSNYLSITHDYALIYSKSKEHIKTNWQVEKRNVKDFKKIVNRMIKQGISLLEIEDELKALVKYPKFYDFDHYYYCDKKGVYRTDNSGGVDNGNFKTEIYHPTTNKRLCVKMSG